MISLSIFIHNTHIISYYYAIVLHRILFKAKVRFTAFAKGITDTNKFKYIFHVLYSMKSITKKENNNYHLRRSKNKLNNHVL